MPVTPPRRAIWLGKMKVYEQFFANLDESRRTATQEELEKCEASIGRTLPLDLKRFLASFGWGEGFASNSEDAEYLVVFSPTEISKGQPKELPKHLVVVGSNGGGEWIVANDDAGYGLLPAISDYQSDYQHVASSLEDFLISSMRGQWFRD